MNSHVILLLAIVVFHVKECDTDSVGTTELSFTSFSTPRIAGDDGWKRGRVVPDSNNPGLQPLYSMVNTFLDVVQPLSRGNVFDDPRFQNVFKQADIQTSFVELGKSANDWRFWLRHYVGFAVCAAFGIVFIVAMPIVGLCVCACRCCGRCGAGDVTDVSSLRKRDGCRRVGCGVLLLVINAIITAGLVCSLVTNELIREQTAAAGPTSSSSYQSVNSNGLSSVALSSLQTLSSYQESTVQELQTGVIIPLNSEIQYIHAQINGFINKSIDRLAEITDIYAILNTTASLSNRMIEVVQNLDLIVSYTTELQLEQQTLNGSLTQSRLSLLANLPPDSQCNHSRQCVAIRESINRLTIGPDFTHGQNLTAQIQRLENFKNGDVMQKLNLGIQTLNNFTDITQSTVEKQIQDQIAQVNAAIDSKVNPVISAGQKQVNDITAILQSVDFSNAAQFMNTTITPKLNTYGDYRYFIGIAIGTCLALLVAFVFLGLCFGACAEASAEEGGRCNRRVGSALLLAGVGFTFIFVWILMVAVVVVFVTGGVGYTEACRPVLREQNAGLVKFADDLLTSVVNSTNVSFNLFDVMSSCQKNNGIYSALNLDAVFNISGILQTAKIDIQAAVAELMSSIKPNLGSVDIIDASIFTNLALAKVFVQTGVNFSSFQALLNQPFLSTNLSSFVSQIKADADSAPITPTQREKIYNETDTLETTTTAILQTMVNTSRRLSDVLVVLQNQVGSNTSQSLSSLIDGLITSLNSTQQIIKLNGSDIIIQFVGEFVGQIAVGVASFIDVIEGNIFNNIGQCSPLSDVYSAMTVTVCQSFLDPFNGWWFSVGWCLFFSIPSLIVSVVLSNLYGRLDDYYTANTKTFEDAGYDAYSGAQHGDSFQLDDFYLIPPSSRSNGNHSVSLGHRNAVYEPDDAADPSRHYPGARTNTEGMTTDPGFIHYSYSSPA